MDVFGSQPSVLFVEVRHGPRSPGSRVSLEEPFGCGRFRRLGHDPKIGCPRPTRRRTPHYLRLVALQFEKWEGTGNDFVLVDGRQEGRLPSTGRSR